MQMKSYCSVGGDTAHIRDLCTSILILNDRRNTNEETFNTNFENRSILTRNPSLIIISNSNCEEVLASKYITTRF